MQRHDSENSTQKFPENELRGISPNFHIHVSLNDLNIPTIGLPILLQGKYVERSWVYINRYQTHECCGNWV
jgi:hypothetical protein